MFSSARGFEVAAERLFDVHAAPTAVAITIAGFARHAGAAQLTHDLTDELRRDGQIVEVVVCRLVRLGGLGDLGVEPRVRSRILQRAADVVDALPQPRPQRGSRGSRLVRFHRFVEVRAEGLSRVVARGEADDGEMLGQQVVPGEVVQRGDELALGQIAARAEDHHHARIGGIACRRGAGFRSRTHRSLIGRFPRRVDGLFLV